MIIETKYNLNDIVYFIYGDVLQVSIIYEVVFSTYNDLNVLVEKMMYKVFIEDDKEYILIEQSKLYKNEFEIIADIKEQVHVLQAVI